MSSSYSEGGGSSAEGLAKGPEEGRAVPKERVSAALYRVKSTQK